MNTVSSSVNIINHYNCIVCYSEIYVNYSVKSCKCTFLINEAYYKVSLKYLNLMAVPESFF